MLICVCLRMKGGQFTGINFASRESAVQANIELGGQGGRQSVFNKVSVHINITRSFFLLNLRNFFCHLSKLHSLQVRMKPMLPQNAAANLNTNPSHVVDIRAVRSGGAATQRKLRSVVAVVRRTLGTLQRVARPLRQGAWDTSK